MKGFEYLYDLPVFSPDRKCVWPECEGEPLRIAGQGDNHVDLVCPKCMYEEIEGDPS